MLAGPGNSDRPLADGPQIADVERRPEQAISRRGKSFNVVTPIPASLISRLSANAAPAVVALLPHR